MNDYKELIEQLNGACIVKVVMKDMTKADLFARAADAIEQLVKERDAAINDISISESCLTCNHKNCHAVHGCEWEWRGVQRTDT